jgi:hypothetical protein
MNVLLKSVLLSLGFWLHPFFMSVTEIEHNAADRSLEISCKIFTDDFEKTLKAANNNVKIDLTAGTKDPATKKYVSDYIRKHLKVEADGTVANLEFIGYEVEREAVWAYFQAMNIPTVKNLTVTNSLLHDFSDKQINMIHVTVGSRRKSNRLNYPDAKAEFNF